MKYHPLKYLLPGATALVLSVSAGHAADSSDVPPYRPLSLGVDVGTVGAGGSLSWRFLDNLGVQVGADYASYSGSRTIKEIDYTGNLQLLSEPLTVDVYPWTGSSFHVSLGAVLNEFEVGGTASGALTINGTPYVGTVDLTIRQQLIDPYIGIGGNMVYFDHAHHWALTGALGAMYTGDPRVSLTGTSTPPAASLQPNLDVLRNEIHHDARYGEFWPVAKLGVSYSF